MRNHVYAVSMEWTGNRGTGTSAYRAYGRDHVVRAAGKPDISGSADRVFFGDAESWNPEELLVAALAQCHMLSFLHVACDAGVVVLDYRDDASGTLHLEPEGAGQMTEVVLRPNVTVREGHGADIDALHHRAHDVCFIARSVNFPVRHEAQTRERSSL